MSFSDFLIARTFLQTAKALKHHLRVANAKMHFKRLGLGYMNSLFEGKHVAIVAGSPQLVGKGKGREIDGHDLVVRFNLFHPTGRENDLGVRTDVRFVGCTLVDKHMPYISNLMGAEQIITTSKNYSFMKDLDVKCLYFPAFAPILSFDWLAKVCQGKLERVRSNRPPRSGIVFLSMLMKYGAPARITLYGFSMSLVHARQVIDYTAPCISTYDADRYLINHCDPAIEVSLLRQLKQLEKIYVGG
jgi:hypothetical protein